MEEHWQYQCDGAWFFDPGDEPITVEQQYEAVAQARRNYRRSMAWLRRRQRSPRQWATPTLRGRTCPRRSHRTPARANAPPADEDDEEPRCRAYWRRRARRRRRRLSEAGL